MFVLKTKNKYLEPSNLMNTRQNPRKRKLYDPSDPPQQQPSPSVEEREVKPKIALEASNLEDLIKAARSGVDYCNINTKGLRKIVPALKELNRLVGMKSLKETVFNQVVYYLQNLHKDGDDYLHTVIHGPPGCGKTTVARLIGTIFSKLGILSKNKFEVATRDDLVAGYLGQTALKTALVLEMCKGGVLFIDEIYSLGDKEQKDSFAKECIDTINLFLSENKEDFMLIVAGYEKEVDTCFFAFNPGLRRRFMWYHTIEPYTAEDLSTIFRNKVEDAKWSFDEKVTTDSLIEMFKKNDKKFKCAGGDIENFLTLCKIKHSRRVLGKDEALHKKLDSEDLNNAMEVFNVKKDVNEPPPPPMMMYL